MQKYMSFSYAKTEAQTKVELEGSVRINIDRMSKALATETVRVPSGLSREETRQFILAHSK